METHNPLRFRRHQAIFLSMFLLAASFQGVAHTEDSATSRDSIKGLNILFRQEYAEARKSQLANASPVIIVRGDYLILIRGGKKTQGSSVHSNYHELKTISHGPLALFCILCDCLDKPLSATHSKKLTGLRTSLTEAAGELESAFEDPTQRSRQEKLLQGCIKFIDSVLKNEHCNSKELDTLIRGLRPSIVQNAAEAARMRIDNYHAQMKRWRRDVSDDQWRNLYVIIPGAAMPRTNSLPVGYFAKLFEQEGEGNRVIYAESQFQDSQALKLLGTHLLDSRIGTAFFDDSSRMKRDLLGPYAEAYLDALDFQNLR
jgi:hypothetical protein